TGRSILDSVQNDLARLSREVGPQDRARLDDYTSHVREAEKIIERAEQQSSIDLQSPDAPVGIPEMFADHVGLQCEPRSRAWEADLTRVFSFRMSRDVTQRTYPGIGITEPHHAMSHHGGNEEMKKNLVKLNVYHMTLFAKFVERLANTPDGNGSMLDNSMILYGSGMSESNN